MSKIIVSPTSKIAPPHEQASLRSTIRLSMPESSGHASSLSHDGATYTVHTGRFRPNAENRYQDYALTQFDTATAKRKGKLPLPVDVSAMALGPQGTHMATGETGLAIKGHSYVSLWDMDDPDALAAGEPKRRWLMDGAIRDVKFLADGMLLAGSALGWIKLIDPKSDAELWSLEQEKHINDVVISNDRRHVLHTAIHEAHLWDVERAEKIGVAKGDAKEKIENVRFSPDGSRFLLKGRQLHVFDTSTQEKLFSSDPDRFVEFAEFSPCGRIVMALRRPGEFTWLDAESGAVLHCFEDLGHLRFDHGFMSLWTSTAMTETDWVLASYKSIWQVPLPT